MTGLRFFIVLLGVCLMASPVMAAERMAVKSEVANVRSDPGREGDILWKMERYYPVIVIEARATWFRFKDFDGHQGWVHNSLLDKTPTVIVRVRLANIRTGPSTEFDVAFEAEKGTPFKVLGKNKEGWIQIQHSDGDKGWVFKSLVW